MFVTDAVAPARGHAVSAGIVTALVGFTGSFAVVLTGLTAVGATPSQSASGLLVLSITMGLSGMWLAWRYRMPITVAWSTPGGALLAATGTIEGGWAAAVGAFLVVAVLILITGLWPFLGTLIARIPAAIAQAMLAGVLLPLCLAPVSGLAANPWGVAPVILTWVILARFSPRWSVPAAFVTAAVVVGLSLYGVGGAEPSGASVDPTLLLPVLEFTAPTFTVGAIVGVALPLFLVTMASQNVPGVAIMRSYGYEVPWRPAMLATGAGTALGAVAGGHAINLAAISAALAAAPDVDPNPKRRWIAGMSAGVSYLVLGAASGVFAVLVILAPAGVIPAVAGLALLSAFGSAVQQAIENPSERLAAVITFIVAASGLSIGGVSAAFWALIAGLAVRTFLRR